MTTSMSYTLFFYLFSIFFFLQSSSYLIFWILMELNLICFFFMIYYDNKIEVGWGKSLDICLFYFLIQSMGSIIYLFSILLIDSYSSISNLLFFLSISLKMAIFPLFFWMLNLGGSLSSMALILLLTFQKIPMFFIVFNLNSMIIMMFLFISLIFGCILIFLSTSMNILFISSSISTPLWIYILYIENFKFFFFFFFFYFIILYTFFYSGSNQFTHTLDITKILMLLFLGGLPPMSFFFLKFYIFGFIFNKMGILSFSTFWFFSFLCLVGYFKFFHVFFYFFNSVYLKQKFCKKKSSMIVNGVIFFPLFFI